MQAFDNFNGQNQRTFYYQAGNVQISAKINLPEGTCGDDMQPSWHIGNRQAQDQRRDSRMGSNVNNDGMRNTDQSLRRQEISCTPPMRYENRHGSQHFHERQQQMSSNNVGNEQRSEGRGTVGQYCNGQVITPPSREERMRELNGQNQRQPRCYLGANGNFNGTRPNDATRPPMSNGSKKKAKASRRDDSSDDDLYADDPNDPDYDPHLHMIVVSTKKEPVMPEQQSLSLTGDENHQNEGSNNME
ncbi:uncharacterized protein CELE_K05G3.2 [Caenorhabditis elegans]|uniref:Uncharacterized protein n=1 Tax=Caenorhabditis elegans TaxID=6239 RepID=Q21249_CAEEL|nr:Uncharacterized protein CELE_K05G3.2 [Caenorhabditis elegans]CCD72691.1 Uncharacterized protein CELE_K05G3.2 [Caenorhabditis elegans]|eukprot:NP_510675.2 Uncharacterized protein CELE_K05G3.2 [Caenorhabditis elegans]